MSMSFEALLKEMREKELEDRNSYKYRISVCCSSGCMSLGALKILKAFEDATKEFDVRDICTVSRTGCVGTCYVGPVVIVDPGDYMYQNVNPESAREIVCEHIVNDRPVKNLLYTNPDFFQKQHKVVMRNAGKIDPLRIEDYIAMQGYYALLKVVTQMSPRQVIDEVRASDLRGRGGAGFVTGQKWDFVEKAQGSPKYIVANLDEGDPGVFANRTLAEADPHAILEGMLIAAYAIGAQTGYIYIRAEYPLAVQTLRKAIQQARSMGFLGKNIFGTNLSFDIDLRLGAGAFIAGEEMGILASIEGRRAMPRPRPPYPAMSGLFGKPTLINNVETLANIPIIMLNGSRWFSEIGVETCKGTKCFSLTGKVNNPGLIEVPMGITLRDVVFSIGGGVAKGRKFKAVLVGGPSGGCLPESCLDLPIDYDSLTRAGAIMGSGGIVVIDDTSCMVDTAKFFTEFCVDESCGKCVPCRVGLVKTDEILQRITNGRGKPEDLDLLESLGYIIRDTSLCGLGQTAPNPVLSTIRYFRDEYDFHITEHRCPAGKCFKEEKIDRILSDEVE
jgi:NADP-reducing hydrogenase subunit HndC